MNRTILTTSLAGAALAATVGLGAQQSSSPTPITIVPITPISPSSGSAPPATPPSAPPGAVTQPMPPFQPGAMTSAPPISNTPPALPPGMAPVGSNPAAAPPSSAYTPTGTAAAPAPVERVLNLTFNTDGTVSLLAKGVAARDIMAEWKRKCGCTVMNAEKMTGGMIPVPVQFEAAPQRTVIDSVLRGAAGYTLTPRRPNSTSVSNYETIHILATSTPSASASPYAGSPTPAPYATPGSPDDELPPVTPMVPPPQTQAPAASRPAAPPTQPGVFVPLSPVTPGPTTPPATTPGGRGNAPLPGGRGGGAQ